MRRLNCGRSKARGGGLRIALGSSLRCSFLQASARLNMAHRRVNSAKKRTQAGNAAALRGGAAGRQAVPRASHHARMRRAGVNNIIVPARNDKQTTGGAALLPAESVVIIHVANRSAYRAWLAWLQHGRCSCRQARALCVARGLILLVKASALCVVHCSSATLAVAHSTHARKRRGRHATMPSKMPE